MEQASRANSLERALAEASLLSDTKSVTAHEHRLNEVISLLQLTDDKLQLALENCERSEARCLSLEDDLAQSKQELCSVQHTADATHLDAQAKIEAMQSMISQLLGVKAELDFALNDLAASRAAFSTLRESASSSVADAQQRIMQEWSQRVAELEEVKRLRQLCCHHSCSSD